MKRFVIADTGPLIALARLGKLDLLQRLFGTVLVTSWVVNEVLAGGDFPDTAALRAALAQPWLQTIEPADMPDIDWQEQCRDLLDLYQIDLGEASSLVLAQHLVARGEVRHNTRT